MAEHSDVRVETSQKRVRAYLGGEIVGDTTDALLVWEKPYYPTYYLPVDDITDGVLVETGQTRESSRLGTGRYADVKTAGGEAPGAALRYVDAPDERVRGAVRLDFDAMDAWFEEDEQIHVHPRDPYTRIDVLRSSRHVRIEIDGVTVAESDRPVFVFETGLPRRTYLPKTDVRLDLLEPTDHHTHCPYKGTASWYDVVVDGTRHENLAWWYPFAAHESTGIEGLVCFYDEKVDVVLDGERLERPDTHFA